MTQYIDKSALIAEIENRIDRCNTKKWSCPANTQVEAICDNKICAYKEILSFLNTTEVKNDSLENFKSLQHISRDLKSTLQDWGYAPNLYFCDGMWHVSWISCEEGDGIKGFEGNTPEEAIDKACNWFHSTFCNS